MSPSLLRHHSIFHCHRFVSTVTPYHPSVTPYYLRYSTVTRCQLRYSTVTPCHPRHPRHPVTQCSHTSSTNNLSTLHWTKKTASLTPKWPGKGVKTVTGAGSGRAHRSDVFYDQLLRSIITVRHCPCRARRPAGKRCATKTQGHWPLSYIRRRRKWSGQDQLDGNHGTNDTITSAVHGYNTFFAHRQRAVWNYGCCATVRRAECAKKVVVRRNCPQDGGGGMFRAVREYWGSRGWGDERKASRILGIPEFIHFIIALCTPPDLVIWLLVARSLHMICVIQFR